MEFLKSTASIVTSIVIVCLIIFGFNEAGYLSFAHFAPKFEQVRRNTFTQSQEYNEGMTRHLYELRRQYLATTDAGSKAVLRDTFLHDADGYPNELPPDLQSFKLNLEGNQ